MARTCDMLADLAQCRKHSVRVCGTMLETWSLILPPELSKHFACHASNGFKYVEWTIVQLESVEDTDHCIAFITLMLYSLNDTDTGISYSICGCSCALMNWILSNFHIPGHLVMKCDDCIRIYKYKRTK